MITAEAMAEIYQSRLGWKAPAEIKAKLEAYKQSTPATLNYWRAVLFILKGEQ